MLNVRKLKKQRVFYSILVTTCLILSFNYGDSFYTNSVRKKVYQWTTQWMHSETDFEQVNSEFNHLQPERDDNEILDTRDYAAIFNSNADFEDKNYEANHFEDELMDEGLEYSEENLVDDLNLKDQYELPDVPVEKGGFVDDMGFPENDHSHYASLFEGPEVRTKEYLKQKDFPCDQHILTNRTGYKVYDLLKSYRHKDRKAVKARRENRMELWNQNNEIFKAEPLKNGPIFSDPDVPIKYPVNLLHLIPGKSLKLNMIELLKFPENEHAASKTKLTMKSYFGKLYGDVSCKIKGNNTDKITLKGSRIRDCLKTIVYQHAAYQPKGAVDVVEIQYWLSNEEVFEPVYVQLDIKHKQQPVLFDYKGTRTVENMVTVILKTFIRNKCLGDLLHSIREFYPKIKIIVADDSPEKFHEIAKTLTDTYKADYYIMPEYKGWNSGRNLVLSQASTEYVLWVDDDFQFTKHTDLRLFLKFLEENPYYDLVAGQVDNKDMSKTWGMFNRLIYDDADKCVIHTQGVIHDKDRDLDPKNKKFVCRSVDMTINFWMGRTLSLRNVGYDNEFERFAHKEFFVDGRGKLAIAQCSKPTVHHNEICKRTADTSGEYSKLRRPVVTSWVDFLRRWYFRNGLDYMVERSHLPAPHDKPRDDAEPTEDRPDEHVHKNTFKINTNGDFVAPKPGFD